MSNLGKVISESFTQYAGATLQSRALVDVRDCFKPSARQIFYCMQTDKFTSDKPFKKTLKAIGSAMRMYIHGDSSCEGVIMRAGQPFAMRYPIVEVEGSFGNLMESGNWAAPRYTASRLSKIANCLFADINKNVIAEWRDNYDDTEQYPTVLPSKGFYNIVNGTLGIGVGAASSIPQFNLKEVNEALIKLLWNPDISFEELYCAPDFATGATLLNENEIKDSLKNGTGFACKLRAVIEYDPKERCLIATEIPYGVYTNTICGELEAILIGDDNPGIDRFNDLTGSTPLIKIYLAKNANIDKVIKYLYKNTSLQSFYGINMTMLENGRYPRVFGWKEALQSHINHEEEVYRKGYEFDLNKIKDRIHIIEGLLIALANIEEVVQTIKSSTSTSAASQKLKENFLLTDAQAKAILDMKLSRLAHLEVKKLEDEKTDLEIEKEKIENILNNKELLFKEIETGLRAVATKFGDSRRTKILNVEGEEDEPTEIKTLQVSLTNKNNIFVSEVSTLYTQKRGGVGNKIKLDKEEYVISSTTVNNNEVVMFFTNQGNYYHTSASNLTIDQKTPVELLFTPKSHELTCAITSTSKKNSKQFIIFFTKNGYIKKSEFTEYNVKRAGGAKAIALDSNDEIVSVQFTNEEKAGILSEEGNFLLVETKDIRPISRVSKGIKGIKLNDGDGVSNARIIPNDYKGIISISGDGLFKKTEAKDFVTQGKNTKGSKLQKVNEGDFMADFFPYSNEKEVLIASRKACIKVNIDEIPTYSRGAQGVKAIKLAPKDSVIRLA
jgi:DNA gyrase subunit A